ncbi:hypothetical protein RRF57_012203 [Xylaria bambusicola]|uniref:Uncharacterized protein n=1 Tax=Xylaria bambusicola TaxID=326684 RepID=A0AAN7V0C5_9PEZI
MANANQLFLLADHIKLSLLERQRAQSLDISGDSNDGHISRSLDQFKDGLAALENELKRLQEAGDEDAALDISDSLPGLQKQYGDLTAQFHGFTSPSTTDTLTHANDPSLNSDFEHATQKPSASNSSLRPKNARTVSKTRGPRPRGQLFGSRYRDNPDDTMGYRDEANGMTNVQIHQYHQRVLEQQDEHWIGWAPV